MLGPKKSTRGSTSSFGLRKSRTSARQLAETTTSGQKVASSHNTISGSDSDGEEENKHTESLPASDVTIYNEYRMGPAFGCKFPLQYIRLMIERLLSIKFKGKTYQPGDAVKWVREIADEINFKMEGLCHQPRYKHVIQAIIYQQNGAGFFCGARAIWDDLSDDYASLKFDAGTFVCIVVIFGIYQY